MTLLFLLLNAYADETNVIYKKKTEIDFEAVDIEGQLKKPQGSLVSEQQRAIFNPLVKIRQEWHLEMIDSVNDIE